MFQRIPNFNLLKVDKKNSLSVVFPILLIKDRKSTINSSPYMNDTDNAESEIHHYMHAINMTAYNE